MNAKYEKWSRFYTRMESLGFMSHEADALRRIEMTLSKWAEHECNGVIQRHEETDRPYTSSRVSTKTGKTLYYWTADREKGALKRLEKIMQAHPELKFFHQTDPRGCALYILRPGDVPEGQRPDAYYSRGVAVCL